MAHHPLQQRIHTVRSRVVRLLAIRGLSAIVAAVLATVIVLGGLDYLLRFRDRGVLLVFAVAILGVLGWTGYRAVRRLLLLKARLGDTDVALHVEACFPAVKDRLASAVEFLRQPEDDAAAGSAAMRRATISQAAAASEGLDFGAVLDRRPALRSALAALTVGVLAVCLSAADASATRTALARLAFPLGTADWPQRTHLGLRPPIKPFVIVRGQPLDVEVIDTEAAPLPPDCHIHYRLTDTQGRTREESEPMQYLGKAMVARRENVRSPLEFRFTGGDDRNMNWIQVQVIDPPEPPAVCSLTAHGYPSRLHQLARGRARGDIASAAIGRLARATCRQNDETPQAGEQAAVRRRPRASHRDRRRRQDVPRGETVCATHRPNRRTS